MVFSLHLPPAPAPLKTIDALLAKWVGAGRPLGYNGGDTTLQEVSMTRPILLLARLNAADLAVDATKTRLIEIAEALREPSALVAAREEAASAEAYDSSLQTC